MELNLTYPELALVRELVKQHREKHISEFLRMCDRRISTSALIENARLLREERNPFEVHGLCGGLLDKIDALEEEIVAKLRNR